MRVVVTGSGGRVGRAIYVRLAREHDVVGLDRLPASEAVRYVGDLCDRALLAAAFRGADAVVHAAALHAPHVGVVADAEFERVNVDGTASVIAAAREAGVRRIVFTSSTAVYGRAAEVAGEARWIDEDVEPMPVTIYHRTKLAAERLLQTAAERDGIDVRVLRMSRCFPEPARLMAVYRLYRGVDARDVAEAHALALTDRGARFGAFVVSGATPFARADLAALHHDAPAILARKAPDLVAAYAARGWPLPRSIDRVYSSARAIGALGWRPRHGFADVLALLDLGLGEVLP
jgi:nucleoside-diphosphate-sugar epimerase